MPRKLRKRDVAMPRTAPDEVTTVSMLARRAPPELVAWAIAAWSNKDFVDPPILPRGRSEIASELQPTGAEEQMYASQTALCGPGLGRRTAILHKAGSLFSRVFSVQR